MGGQGSHGRRLGATEQFTVQQGKLTQAGGEQMAKSYMESIWKYARKEKDGRRRDQGTNRSMFAARKGWRSNTRQQEKGQVDNKDIDTKKQSNSAPSVETR
jgi:hypothetical protein